MISLNAYRSTIGLCNLSLCPKFSKLRQCIIPSRSTVNCKSHFYLFIYLFIIFISSWYKIVKSTNKNQPSTRYNYSFHATVRTKENARLDIISSTVKTTACIYWIPIHTIQLKFYYK